MCKAKQILLNLKKINKNKQRKKMNPTSEDTILQDLFEQRRKLNETINQFILKKYQKYQGMSVEVKDDNPYRLIEQ